MINYKAFKNFVSYSQRCPPGRFPMRCLGTHSVSPNAVTAWESAKPFLKIPSLPMLPFVGTAWHYMPIIGTYRKGERYLLWEEKQQKLGDIVLDKFGPLHLVACYSAEDLQEIKKNEGNYPYMLNFAALKAYRAMRTQWYSTIGIVAEKDKEWHHLRSKTQKHLLKPQVSLDYLEPIQNVAKDLVLRINEIREPNDEVPDLLPELCKYTLESFAFIGLDTRLGLLNNGLSAESDGMRILQSTHDQNIGLCKLEPILGNIQFWKYFNTPTWKKYVEACDTYAELSFKYINQALMDLENNKGNAKKRPTLIQSLKMQNQLEIQDLMVLMADFLMAGVDTVANTIGFLLYRLAKNPAEQELLYQDTVESLSTQGMKITGKNYALFPYLRACIKESMRMNPVAYATVRILANDTVLSGYQVPAGTLVGVPFQQLFNDERYYENPKKFRPERWINKELKNPFAFIPFGFGPRSCVGRKVAELKIMCAVIEIIRNYRLEYHYEDIGSKTLLLGTPDKELRFAVIKR